MITSNVGIGTTAPLNKLDVNGGMAIGSYAGTNSATSNGLIVSGCVGIGTTAPLAKLHIGGTAGVDGIMFPDGTLQKTASNGGGTVTGVATGTGLTGGPITASGTLSLANSGVTAGSYTRANVIVDATGRLTTASSGAAAVLSTTDVTGVLSVFNGGTGASSFALNTVPLGGGAGNLTYASAGTAGQVFRISSAGGAPAFGAIDLSQSASVTGTLQTTRVPWNNPGAIGSSTPASGAFTTITIAAGTAGSPSHSFTADTATGLYQPATSHIGFSTGGSEKMRINSSGCVGIGTSSPGYALDVAGAIHSGSGGFKFPDGSVQTSANNINLGVTQLTDGPTIAVNGSAGSVFEVTLGGNRGLANPTGLIAGVNYTFIFVQDATGGRTLSFGSNYIFPPSVGTPTLSPGAGTVNAAQFISDGTYLYYLSGFANASAPCLSPTNVTASVTVGASSVTTDLTWIDPNLNPQNDVIQRSPDGITWSSLLTESAGTTSASYTDSNVATQSYYWRVTANCGISGTNSSIAVQGTSAVAAPSSFTHTETTTTSQTLNWTNTAGASSYEISRSVYGTEAWSVIATPSQGTTSYVDSNLALNVMYSYRIRALQGGVYSSYYSASVVCPTAPAFTCGSVGNDCYSNASAVYGAYAVTPSGRCLTMVYANGSSGFTVWKDQFSSKILSANGLDSWSMALNSSGKGQSTTAFSDSNLGNASTVLAGRTCPTNVYIDDNNKLTTTNCLYYTPSYSVQTVNGGWGTTAWYYGNIATCSGKGMRLPTLYEASVSDPGGNNKPTDASPTFNAGNGVPDASGWTWTASTNTSDTGRYWVWSGTNTAYNYYNNYDHSAGVRCVIP